MQAWSIKRHGALVQIPWRNGLGTTRDVITVLHPDGSLRWQVGIADLVRDADFSHFPHCDRVFTPIAGDPPPELSFEGGPFVPCPLLTPKPFPGDIATQSRIPAPGRAFNAVVDRRRHTVRVTVLRDTDVPDGGATHSVLFCHAGEVALGEDRLGPGDCAIAGGAALPGRVRGTALLVCID